MSSTRRGSSVAPQGTFGERLQAAMAEHGPLCAGIDPHREGRDVSRAEFDGIAVSAREALNEVRALLGVLRLDRRRDGRAWSARGWSG